MKTKLLAPIFLYLVVIGNRDGEGDFDLEYEK
jgi:hypothetical protein